METFTTIAIIIWLVLSIIIFVKLWGMCNDVRKIYQRIFPNTTHNDMNDLWGMCNDVRAIKQHLLSGSKKK